MERRNEAARRLGAPHCQKCKRLGVTEHVKIWGDDEDRGGKYYIGVDYCAGCAEEMRELQRSLDELDKIQDVIESVKNYEPVGGLVEQAIERPSLDTVLGAATETATETGHAHLSHSRHGGALRNHRPVGAQRRGNHLLNAETLPRAAA